MSIALLAETEVGQLPQAEPLRPRSIDRFLPPAVVLGLAPESTPTFVLRARWMAESNPTSVVAWARLAQAEQVVENAEAAIEAATRALSLSIEDGKHVAASLSAAALLASLQPELRERVAARFDHPLARLNAASAAIERGSKDAALKHLKGVESPSAHALRAFSFVIEGEYQAAVAEYRAARKSGHESLDVLINLGFALSHLGSLEKAIRVTQEATRQAPDSTVASYNLARYLMQSRRRGLAAKELDRLAAARSWDDRVILHQAWAHAYNPDGMRSAIRILAAAQNKFRSSSHAVGRAEIVASIGYLKWRLGDTSSGPVRRALWQQLRSTEYRSGEIVRMLLTMLDRLDNRDELHMLIEEAGDALGASDRLLAESKLLLISGDLDAATDRAVQASDADKDVVTNAAATAAYLLGEVRGEYSAGAALAAHAFSQSPDVGMGNNYAFSLALSGDGEMALRVLAGFDHSELPFHGATRGLALLAVGRVAEGLEAYREAEALMRAEGKQTTADYIGIRCALACRQLGINEDGADEIELDRWPADRGESRWLVLCRVAERVGIRVPIA